MNLIKTIFSIATLCSSLVLAACQKPTENSTVESNSKIDKSIVAQPAAHTSVASVIQDCQHIDMTIQTLKKTYSPKDLNTLNQLLKKCLPDVPLKIRYQWQSETTTIYAMLQEKLPSNVMQYLTGQTENGEKLSASQRKSLYQTLNNTEKYWVDHAKALYLDKFYLGEGEYTVVQHPQYDLDIFAPYLTPADQVYFNQIRQEYTGKNYILDAGLSISFGEVAARLLFWQDFKQVYPKNHYQEEVNQFIKQYTLALFRGDENTRTLWFDEDRLADPDAIEVITKVAQTTSPSHTVAQKFLELVQTNEPLWQQLPKPSYRDDDYDSPEQQDIRKQRDTLQHRIEQAVKQLLRPYDA